MPGARLVQWRDVVALQRMTLRTAPLGQSEQCFPERSETGDFRLNFKTPSTSVFQCCGNPTFHLSSQWAQREGRNVLTGLR
jgi:hypothetical protein